MSRQVSPSLPQSPKEQSRREPIAIVGIGCRFPGASDPMAFWKLLRDGLDMITEVPKGRFDISSVYDAGPAVPGKTQSRFGAFLPDVDSFDADLFRVSPREAARMDPQQRLLLETAWDAFEDAGFDPDRLVGSKTGVFVGACASDYNCLQLYRDDPARIDIYSIAGGSAAVLSGRVSYIFGLHGPSLTLDTACSSSLVAIYMAMQSLRTGDSAMALAGGVNLVLSPELSIGFSSARMLSPDGRCKAFDSRANGFVRSDGVGLLVLKPLARAQADGDSIYAVILGGAVNNDGQGSGMMMPNQKGQEAVVRLAHADAGVAPADIDYVEAHGTGTPVGDPIEAQALGSVLKEGRPADRPCLIGSVKTNIGHTEGAAGVAGVIKTALSLKHRVIPPSLHVKDLSPKIPWDRLQLTVPRAETPWPSNGKPALAGVSSFGISGTNVHLVLSEAPADVAAREAQAGDGAHFLALSAHTPESLQARARDLLPLFSDGQAGQEPAPLEDLCFTAGARRGHLRHRAAFVGSDPGAMREQIEAFVSGQTAVAEPLDEPPRLAFIFPGQGSQWLGMGRKLMARYPVFRSTLEACDAAIRRNADWSLMEELRADESASGLNRVDVIQPAIFSMQVSLAALWRSWGIEPDAVAGQSLGEVAAACVAGALSLEDAASVICRRSQLVRTITRKGAMAVVGLSLEESRRALAGYEQQASIAVSSSPNSTVLSGDPDALMKVLDPLERKGVFCRWINVDYASHGPQMDALREELPRSLAALSPRASTVPFYSTVTTSPRRGEDLDPAYWFRNIREPVMLSDTIKRLLDDGHRAFIEVSPHPVLASTVQQCVTAFGKGAIVLPSMRNDVDEREVMLRSLGDLYAAGRSVSWSGVFPQGGRPVRLPQLPRQRERYWFKDAETEAAASAAAGVEAVRAKGLLGPHIESALQPGTHLWEARVGLDDAPYLADHKVRGSAVLPAAAYVEMALSAADQAFKPGPHALEDVKFEKALFLPEAGTVSIQLVITGGGSGTASFQFVGRSGNGAAGEGAPIVYARGSIRLNDSMTSAESAAGAGAEIATIRTRFGQPVAGVDHYTALGLRGLQYGSSFQIVESIARQENEALGRLVLPERLAADTTAYKVHPALLDGCFQVLAALVPGDGAAGGGRQTWMPVGVSRVRLNGSPVRAVWGHALVKAVDEERPGVLRGDLRLLDEQGHSVMEVTGMVLHKLEGRSAAQPALGEWFYEFAWPVMALSNEGPDGGGAERGTWVIVSDGGRLAADLASLLRLRGDRAVIASYGDAFALDGADAYKLHPDSPEDADRLLRELLEGDRPACHGIVYLAGLATQAPNRTTLKSLDTDLVQVCGGALRMVQALARLASREKPRLFLVTRGVQAIDQGRQAIAIAQSPLWGLGRVVANENPELSCRLVDLDPASSPMDASTLLRELDVEDGEAQVALRKDGRHVARLVRRALAPVDRKVEPVSVPADHPFRLESASPGMMDSLSLRSIDRRPPGAGEVEIRVQAAGLNFSDVMKALALYPGLPDGPVPLGIECSGRIEAVGEGVNDLRVGDEVVAFTPFTFASFVTTPAARVHRKPDLLSHQEAATIPIAFLTAYYALVHLARLQKGERVLIHSAAGGVGLAAVQIARHIGAEIVATAGSDEKRRYLRDMGIEQVHDSRSTLFAREILEFTGGKGVDVVLNSLSGDAIAQGMSVLRPYGRFLEIGKRDIYQNSPLGMAAFKNNVSFFAIDLDHTMRERPDILKTLFAEVMALVERKAYKPLPSRAVPMAEAPQAFRLMSQAKHIGKIVLTAPAGPVMVAPRDGASTSLHADGTYLITGGLGGLGLAIADWMSQAGAGALVLTGRSAPTPDVEKRLEVLRRRGTSVTVARADVADEAQVSAILTETIAPLPPLRGVVHAAGILDDGTLPQMNLDRFRSVMGPKIRGAWNLHRLTSEMALDFFVMFSSASTVFGAAGQANYAAANAFLDALAYHRRALGRPSLAINWGAWGEVGLASRPDRLEWLKRQGLMPLTNRQGVSALERLLQEDLIQVMVNDVDWDRFMVFQSKEHHARLLADIHKPAPAVAPEAPAAPAPKPAAAAAPAAAAPPAPAGGQGLTRASLLATAPAARQVVLESFLKEHVARILGLPASKLSPQRSLLTMGLDSLMATEIRNRIEASLGVSMPVTTLLQGCSVADVTKEILEQVTAASASAEDRFSKVLAQVDKLTPEQARILLAEKKRALAERRQPR